MEWVETTARTIEEAKDSALDQLGVDEQDAEFEVLEEPRPGLFGRMRGEARVRARVAPKAPPPKQERRDRKKRERPTRDDAKSESKADKASAGAPATGSTAGGGRSGAAGGGDGESAKVEAGTAGGARRGGGRKRGSRDEPRTQDVNAESSASGLSKEGPQMSENVTVEEQADIMSSFLHGLGEAFGYEASVRRTSIDDETIELNLQGEDLGLLIGPKGATLSAVQDLARTVVQRQATGIHEGRVRIDVSGYRQRRREALERFTLQVAGEVVATGVRKVLEPMGAADRKIIHDAANTVEGVSTISEGEEPRRRVVILPDED